MRRSTRRGEEVDMRFQERAALVTGAGTGIGRAAAVMFAREGARVGVLSRTEAEVREVVEEIAQFGGEALALTADVSQSEQLQRAVTELGDRWGRLDIAVANAGINGVFAPIDEIEPEEWDETLAINLKGTFLTVKHCLPYLRVRGGAVAIVSSINGTRVFSNPGVSAYACSKAGQVAFAQIAALELARDNIRVNVICPGAVSTEIWENTEQRDTDRIRYDTKFAEDALPLTHGKAGTPEQIAELILFLCSDAAAYISGTPVWIDGGESLMRG